MGAWDDEYEDYVDWPTVPTQKQALIVGEIAHISPAQLQAMFGGRPGIVYEREDGTEFFWPDCAIPGCKNGICSGRSERYCFPHSGGIVAQGSLSRTWEFVMDAVEFIVISTGEALPFLAWFLPACFVALAAGVSVAIFH